MADDDQPIFAGKVGAVLIAMGTASFVVTMYHLIILCCNQQQQQGRRIIIARNPSEQDRSVAAASAPGRSIEESTAVVHLIPAHKYEKKKKKSDDDVADGDEDVTCAVCLGDFEEGEDVRTLPECMHSFHVPCIDMWLYSHSSCPICRADATPSPAMIHRSAERGSGELNAHHSINVMQLAIVRNGLARI